jgi:hypothetical protein
MPANVVKSPADEAAQVMKGVVSMSETAGNGVTVKPEKKGVSLHVTWATIAAILGAGGLLGGREFFPSRPDATVTTLRKTFEEHGKAQQVTESRQGEKIVELGTKIDNLRDDVRDIKQLLLRGPHADAGRTPPPVE